MSSEFKDYDGLIPVPGHDRHYSFRDMSATWICANANPTSWYVGCVIGALGMAGAFWAALIGNPVTYFFLALVGLIGFLVGTSTMALTRVSFGVKGSKLPSLFNAMQFFGWCGVNTYIAANSLRYLLHWSLGLPMSDFSLALSAVLIMGLTGAIAIWGGSKAIKAAENVASVGLMALSIWIAVVVLKNFSLSDILAWRPDEEVRISFGGAIDAIAALGIAWIMAVADYTRYTKTPRSATVAPMVGATVGMFWFCLVGSLSVIAVAVSTGVFDPYTADPATICESLGMGNVAHVLIVVATIAVNLINVFSSGFSTANISDRLTPRTSMVIVTALSVAVALTPLFFGSFLDMFQAFLGYLGAVFPPCIAIVLVDFFILRRRRYQADKLAEVNGPYWYYGGISWYGVGSWLAGVAAYFISARFPLIAESIGSVFFCLMASGLCYYLCGLVFKDRMIREA